MDLTSLVTGFLIAALSATVAWWLTRRAEHGRFEPQVVLLNEQVRKLEARIQDEATEARLRQEESAKLIAKLDQEFSDHRQQSSARESTQARRLAELTEQLRAAESESALLKEQIPALKDRLADQHVALLAEQGKHAALEQALEARSELAAAMTDELAKVRTAREEDARLWAAREADLKATIAEHEVALAGEAQEALKAELDRVRELLSQEQIDGETRLAEQKKKLASAEQRIQMLQKEILSLVNSGSASDAAATVVAAEESEALKRRLKEAELRSQELELKLAQSDSETRKKLREAEYRVCELEFKLAEVEEKKSA